jgi:hypothetical protein
MEYRIIQLTNELPDDIARSFVGKLLDRTHYDTCIDENALVLKPNGEPLLKLVSNVLPASLCEAAWKNLSQVAAQPIIGGSRGTAAGTMLQPARKRDGSPGRMSGVPDVPRLRDSSSAIAGFFDRTVRQPYCRQTTFGPNHRLVRPCLPFIHAVNTVFREHMPDRYAAQMKWIGATAPEFVIRGTSFSTMTINKNFRTAAHTDQGDLQEGFGVLTSLCAGEFSGGELIFPKFRVAVQFRSRDVLLADVHELHGNAPIEGTPGKYERVSCVFYYRENIVECGSPADELAFVKNRKAGDPLFPDRRSHALRLSLPTSSSDASERDANQEQTPHVVNVVTPGLLANAHVTVLTALPEFTNGVQLRIALPEDREKLEAFCKGPTCPKIGREFPFAWRRFHNWDTERNRPTVAFMGDRIVGFHATSYTKGGYCNLYYVVVDTEVKRMGVGKKLIEDSLKRGHALGMTRWTNKSHKGSDGENFFSKHLGIRPIAQKGDEVVYDWSIKDVHACDDIKVRAGSDIYRLDEIPQRRLNAFAKAMSTSGLELLLYVPNMPGGKPVR